MVKVRRGWFLVDLKADSEEHLKDLKELDLEWKRTTLMRQCEDKIARRRFIAEQQEAYEKEKLLQAQRAADSKREEIDTSYRLAIELSRRRDEEVKRRLVEERTEEKPSVPSTDCTEVAIRSRLIEEKINLQVKQEELLKVWQQDISFERDRQAEEETKKRKLRTDLQNQLADNRRRARDKKSEENEQDRTMIKELTQKIREEDARMRKTLRDNDALLRAEIAESVAIKRAWEKEYKETLKHKDEAIARIIEEKEAQQKQLLDKKAKLRAMREAKIDKVAQKMLDHPVNKEIEREMARFELCQEEQMLDLATEPAKLASRKQYAIAESLKEMTRRQKAVAECKAKADAINSAFIQYFTAECEKSLEKEKQEEDARHEKKIQYGKELKEAITNNKVSYAMNIVKRQPKIDVCDHSSACRVPTHATSVEEPDDKKSASKEEIKDTCCN